MSIARRLVFVTLVSAVVLVNSAATAKVFRPGDLRVCNDTSCVPIADRRALRVFGSFYYGSGRVRMVPRPRRNAPSFELRFRDGFVSGLVAGTRLDRIRIHGVNCGRFRRGRWYRLPPRAAQEVRQLTAGLTPVPVDPTTVPRSC